MFLARETRSVGSIPDGRTPDGRRPLLGRTERFPQNLFLRSDFQHPRQMVPRLALTSRRPAVVAGESSAVLVEGSRGR